MQSVGWMRIGTEALDRDPGRARFWDEGETGRGFGFKATKIDAGCAEKSTVCF